MDSLLIHILLFLDSSPLDIHSPLLRKTHSGYSITTVNLEIPASTLFYFEIHRVYSRLTWKEAFSFSYPRHGNTTEGYPS
ncbi:hypothetical protein CEXT_700031 [Caerostris extrusa]|uniref:Uncharacterized protein n=1 Tax=Caerostris extrusa TaxID=172846 RepID=A0AAV4YBS1_CAEEX|nr:hypothetical protein CEXT_700031 [Caerostris extrusa]